MRSMSDKYKHGSFWSYLGVVCFLSISPISLRNTLLASEQPSQIAKTLGSMSIINRSDTKLLDRYLIDVDPRVLAIWVTIGQVPMGQPWKILQNRSLESSRTDSLTTTKQIITVCISFQWNILYFRKVFYILLSGIIYIYIYIWRFILIQFVPLIKLCSKASNRLRLVFHQKHYGMCRHVIRTFFSFLGGVGCVNSLRPSDAYMRR